ncbi:MAG: hypothetical protein KBC17_01415 [Candidatus Pacebacteria bacterium]|nr:hypothetical protein [Candidatus Paceibacterota bacterium]
METRNCLNCKSNFNIEAEDFDFYEKIKVTPPTWCVDCRQQRRYAWRNERTLYRRNCDLCGKSTVTIYSPNKQYKVYCPPCWWGDGWDSSDYGRDFDFSRPFFEQFSELQHDVPRIALLTKNSVKSEYTHHSQDNKNAYLSFSCFGGENIFYSCFIMRSRDCVDCSYIYDAGERLWEAIDTRKSYMCQWSALLKDCSNVLYCYDCHGCTDCFMSSNLRNKTNVFRNEQLTKEEYNARMAEINLASYAVRERLAEEYLDLVQNKTFHKFAVTERNANSTGSMLFNSKNAHGCFDADGLEDSKYVYSAQPFKTCMDIYHAGFNMELCYELHGCTRVSNGQFLHLCYDNMDIMYSDCCQNSQFVFGCVGVKKGEYMILNKKYTKESFDELKTRIVEHMKTTGEYGEYFPPSIAPVAYNETQGNFYMPLTKDETLARGWQWEDNLPGTYGKETIQPEQIPDTISDTNELILKEIFKCVGCAKNYNIIPDEFAFYKREHIPLPRHCADCRYMRRFSMRPPRKLWHGKCMNEGCGNEFETSFAPTASFTVYCESCYQNAVI